MKFFKQYAYTLLLFLGLSVAVGVRSYKDKHRPVAPVVFTAQQKATHRIQILDDNENGTGYCTATAVAPDALLTAEHCIKEGTDTYTVIRIDRSPKIYHVRFIGLDGRDHAILVLDTGVFTNTVGPDPVVVKSGEPVHMYGSGEAKYPPRRLDGVTVDCEDPSDVDSDSGQVCLTLAAIPGDSGSAVYDKNENLVAVITYKANGKYTAVGFGVVLQSFDVQPVPEKKPKKKDDLGDIFKGLF